MECLLRVVLLLSLTVAWSVAVVAPEDNGSGLAALTPVPRAAAPVKFPEASVPVTGIPMTAPGAPVPEPGIPMTAPGASVPEPGIPMTVSGVPVPEPGIPMTVSGVPVPEPGIPMTAPGAPVTVPGSAEAAPASLADRINDFSYRLLLKAAAENGERNSVLGSASVAGLLAMTLLGTVGDTYDELANILGFSEDILENRKNHIEFGSLLDQLRSNPRSRNLFSDAVFVGQGLRPRSHYQEFLQRVYRGECLATDFRRAKEAQATINDWVRSSTAGRIERFLLQPLPTSTLLMLLSSHYFSGQWLRPFRPALTRKMDFHKNKNETVQAEMMLNGGHFRYIHSFEYGAHMVALPYNDSRTVMYALQPASTRRLTQTLPELLARLDWTTIADLIDLMTDQDTVLRFPKMKLSAKTSLRPTLEAVGVKGIFSPEANFALLVEGSGLSNRTEEEAAVRSRFGGEAAGAGELRLRRLKSPGLAVSDVVHQVQLDVDEFGTVASSASGATIGRTASRFYADHPFLVLVRDAHTGLVTFSAVVNDPTQA